MPIKPETKGNMYPGVKTWNPLGGECPHKCGYCSTHNLMRYPVIKAKYSGELRLDEKAMTKNLGHDHTWFVCAQNDLFAESVPDNVIREILAYTAYFPKNDFLFQSKNPARMIDYIPYFPNRAMLGTTIESNRDNLSCEAPGMKARSSAMEFLGHYYPTFITIEPVTEFDLKKFVDLLEFANPSKINIGADSKNNHLPEPSGEKVMQLIAELSEFFTIVRKTNLERLLKTK